MEATMNKIFKIFKMFTLFCFYISITDDIFLFFAALMMYLTINTKYIGEKMMHLTHRGETGWARIIMKEILYSILLHKMGQDFFDLRLSISRNHESC